MKKPIVINFFCFLFSIIFISCQSNSELPMQELQAYALNPKYGLVKKNEPVNEIEIEFIYKPKDLMIAQFAEVGNKAEWDSISAELKTYDYFLLRLARHNREIEIQFAGKPEAYTTALNYLSGGMAKDIRLKVGNDVIHAADVWFTPKYGMSNTTTILIVFKSDLDSRQMDFKIVFDDKMFGTASNEYKFNYEDIKKIPKLKIAFNKDETNSPN